MFTITLCYGPINVAEVWSYRPLRLKKIMELLVRLGYNVTMERIQPRDRLVVLLNGIEIFRCRFSYIKFSRSGNEEYIIKRIVWAALEARSRFQIDDSEYEEDDLFK